MDQQLKAFVDLAEDLVSVFSPLTPVLVYPKFSSGTCRIDTYMEVKQTYT